MSSTPSPPNSQVSTDGPSSVQHSKGFYDFTKRRRWADLVVSELVDSLTFVITPETKVLYCQCGGATQDVLGWTESDFIDSELVDYIHPHKMLTGCLAEDQESFLQVVHYLVRTSVKGSSFARMRPNHIPGAASSIEEAIYEFVVQPCIHPEKPETKVSLVSAKQVAYRNNTSLASLLSDLRQENGILQARVDELRAQLPMEVAAELTSTLGHRDVTNSVYSSSTMSGLDHEMGGIGEYPRELVSGSPGTTQPSTAPAEEEVSEEGSKKKKVERIYCGVV
ncbi:hypothetical protein CC1G_01095 [Coprinopsis cinerea okayama7|uniref:PAS domain-containing protein n=1 Tax=Coprinopsis cinerea (strain Okayama-7 / 130 / ATCC MYA-4618 / FGSC 9003) TaxID=240176 RepID=A8NEI1_COPC7|nr:hypothetical protein CC1G_01095 [Coprinopsis cinerea okayama7\|eukprot:XP_001833033.2 hypothetical protein CC1G_01095 [Coprinopsis cinerea okayama7\